MMRSGFSLIQISILLTVASLVMVTVLPKQNSVIATNKSSNDHMAQVMLALRQFEAANARLPCPADASLAGDNANYGKEAGGKGPSLNCNDSTGNAPVANFVDATNHVAIGMLPTSTLNLPPDAALDGYGRILTYAVDTDTTVCGWPTATMPGTIAISDNGVTSNSVMALVSHGADGHGAFIPLAAGIGGRDNTAKRFNANSSDSDTLLNAHVAHDFSAMTTLTNFVSKAPTATFDDLVFYKNFGSTLNALPAGLPRLLTITQPADGVYNVGAPLAFTLSYNVKVTVTGTPRIALTALGGGANVIGGGTAYATYQSGSGTNTLKFRYSVASSDIAYSGISAATKVDLNGGTIGAGGSCSYNAFAPLDLSNVEIGLSNYASSVYGGTAVSSSTYSSNYSESTANDGNRTPVQNGNYGYWNDSTPDTTPDWLEIDFSSTQTIFEMDAFSLEDNYTLTTPTRTMTGTQYVLPTFEFQYWNGSGWQDIPSGSITGNNLIWRQIKFSPITTNKVRLYVTADPDTWTRLVEFEAWGPYSPPPPWVEDALPPGSNPDGDEGWNWVSSSPAPYSGSLAHQSALAGGEHQHYFTGASSPLQAGVGQTMYTYVYIDPANPPDEIMLQFNVNGSWDHRAYWGGNDIGWGGGEGIAHHYVGPLPATGSWQLLSFPAADAGLEGQPINGMAFTLYNGLVTFDASGVH